MSSLARRNRKSSSQPSAVRKNSKHRLDFDCLEDRVMLTTFVVNSIIDDASGATDGMLSLREAVVAANTNTSFGDAAAGDSDGDIIRFAPSLNGMTYALTNGEILVTDDVKIQAGNKNITIDAQGDSRAFNFASSEIIAVGGLTVANGLADRGGAIFTSGSGTTIVSGTTFIGNEATGTGGGAIHHEVGELYVSNSQFMGNSATGASGSGGALLQLSGSIGVFGGGMFSNTANRAGGAIEIVEGTFNSSNLQVGSEGQGNIAGPAGTAAPGNGGGLHVTGAANVDIFGGEYAYNFAAREGGGLWNQAGAQLEVTNTTIVQNTAAGEASDDGGGGVFNNGGTLVINNAQINGNVASGLSGSGGGLFSTDGLVKVVNTVFEANVANRAGGAIEVVNGRVDLNDVTLGGASRDAGNIAGPMESAAPGNGGGLHVSGDAASVFLRRSFVQNNVAASEGGGLWNQAGSLLRVDNTMVTDNEALGASADNGGGGLFNNGGRLTIVNSGISGNVASGAAGSGGGLFSTDGRILVFTSTLDQNSAARAGGGVEIVNGFLRFTEATLSNNDAGVLVAAAPGNGGGLHVTGSAATVSVRNTEVSGNQAASEGGGLWNQAGSTLRIDSGSIVELNTAHGNDADNGGGGIFNNGGNLTLKDAIVRNNTADGTSGSGGGILSTAGNVTLVDSMVAANATARAGGGIEVIDGFVRIQNSTFDGNDAGVSVAANPGSGGGLHISGNDAIVELIDAVFSNNSAQNQGGGLWNQTGSVIAIHGSSQITGNSAVTGVGGGVYSRGHLELMDAVFESNMAPLNDGGGIFITETGSGTLQSLTVRSNTSGGNGGGIANLGTLNVENSLFDTNSALDGGAIYTEPGAATTENGNSFSGNLPNDRN